MSLVRKRPSAAAVRAAKLARLEGLISPRVARVPARRSTLSPETKYFDTALSFTIPGTGDWTGTEVTCSSYIQNDGTTVGAYTDCALIPTALGTGYGEVQGTKYLLKSVRVRGQINPGAVSDAADMQAGRSIRLVLVMDTMPQGSQAQGESVFTDLGDAVQCNFSYLALGAGTGGRFRILKDMVVRLQPVTAGADSLAVATNSLGFASGYFDMAVNFRRPIEVQLKAGGVTPNTNKLSNCNIFLLAHSSSSTPTITLHGAGRAAYVD